MPPQTLSTATVTASAVTSCPIQASATYPRFDTICKKPPIISPRSVPTRPTSRPPSRPPMIVAHSPNSLVTVAISLLVKPMST